MTRHSITALHIHSRLQSSPCQLVFLLAVLSGVGLRAEEPKLLRLGTGVNFGNMLEAPSEGEWGLKVEKDYFSIVKQAGFDHVRLPISWTYHAAKAAPYTLDETFLARVEELIDAALNARLKVLVNYHHDHELNEKPAEHRERFIAIWRQLADRFQKLPNDQVAFELLNEPQAAFSSSPETWDTLLDETLRAVRPSNAQRTIVVGPVDYNSVRALPSLKLPDDRLLVVTVHYYDPFQFTHQGANWVKPVPPKGVSWNATDVSPAAGWDSNWSWDIRLSGSEKGLTVEYQKAWAGLQFHSSTPLPIPNQIALKVDADVHLKVGVVSKGQRTEKTIDALSGKAIKVDFGRPQKDDTFEELFIQSNSADPVKAFHIQELRLIYDKKTDNILTSAAEKIRSDLKSVADWAAREKRLVYLGEFGAYQEGDMDSRERWTKAVCTVAEEFDFDWSYWEFAAGFGIYDPAKREFRAPLLKALRPK